MARGRLRIYLGAAPGVGKTYAMLQEGARRASRGTDVVVAVVETHGRAQTAAQLQGLEVVPRAPVQYRGTVLEEMDLDAVLARNPQVALVDELAHTNAPGMRNQKRWEDVEVLLEAGIDVVSTVNIQHLESMNDVVAQITGVEQREIIPDAVVRVAEQVQLVDQTPEALRRRLAHGNVYAADRVDAALDNYFRVGNLAALRELALMWVADRVDEGLQRYREDHGITGTWDTRERVVVAITGAPGNDHLIRRAARMAARSRGELLGLHVRSSEGLSDRGTDAAFDTNRELLESLGGAYHEVGSGDVGEALVRFARVHNATQIVLGASNRSRWAELTEGSVINDVIRRSGDIDVHVISQPGDTSGAAGHAPRTPALRRMWGSEGFSRRRIVTAWLLAVAGPVLATVVLSALRDELGLPADLLALTLVVTVVAVTGGFAPALVAAAMSFLLANWYFTPPLHTWTIAQPSNVAALLFFLADAAVIGLFVSAASRRSVAASAARADAETLAALAGASVRSEDLLPALVDQMRRVFSAEGVSVLRRTTRGDWELEAQSGDEPPRDPAAADLVVDLDPTITLAVRGGTASSTDDAVFTAFCAQLSSALERESLRLEAERAERLEEVSSLRAGLLAAVSHDLRTPLASIKAAASTLRQPGVADSAELREEFVGEIICHTDRLTTLVNNLLEIGRIQAGAVQLALRPVAVDHVVGAAIVGLDLRGRDLDLDLDGDVPGVIADPPLLERAIANLVDNACKWAPPRSTVRIDAAAVDDRVAIRVVDGGPGIPADRRAEVFHAFQRIGDVNATEGTGLGLAVAHGFIAQMGGTITVDDTPGGGTTMTVELPAVVPDPVPAPEGEHRR